MNTLVTPPRYSRLGMPALIACAVLWSLGGGLIKLLDEAGVPAVTSACYRSLFAGILFVPIAWPHRRTLGSVHVGWPIGALLTFTVMTACYVIGNTMTQAANVITLQYTSPIWVFLLAPLLLRERPALRDMLVLSVAMVGVAIIFLGQARAAWPALTIGLASGLGYGAVTVTLRGMKSVSPAVVVALSFLGSGLLLVLPVVAWGAFLLTGRQFALMLLLSVVQMALPYLIFTWALRHVEAHRAALILLLEVILNPVWTYLIVGENVPTATLVGGPLILLSVVGWILLTWRREAAAQTGRLSAETRG
jgi:DME family drug/metabolite transporter